MSTANNPGEDNSWPSGAPEEDAEYIEWIRSELERRRVDPRPSIPHDEAVRLIKEYSATWRIKKET